MRPRLRRRTRARTSEQVIESCFARKAEGRGKFVIDLGVTRASFARIKRVGMGLRLNLKGDDGRRSAHWISVQGGGNHGGGLAPGNHGNRDRGPQSRERRKARLRDHRGDAVFSLNSRGETGRDRFFVGFPLLRDCLRLVLVEVEGGIELRLLQREVP